MFHTLSVGFRYKQELLCPAQLNHQWKKNYQNLLIVLLQFKRYCRFVFAEGYKSAKSLYLRAFLRVWNHSHSTGLNWFRLVNIVHPVRSPFDYLIYPYYPAYHPFCYHFVISVDNKGGELQWIIALLFYQNNGQFQKVLRQWREKRPLRLSSSFFIPLSHRAVFFS